MHHASKGSFASQSAHEFLKTKGLRFRVNSRVVEVIGHELSIYELNLGRPPDNAVHSLMQIQKRQIADGIRVSNPSN